MPRAMNVVFPMEIVILPKTTYIMIEYLSMLRRIYTDGRNWPEGQEPSFMGYSIGKWVDEGGTGQYNLLEVENSQHEGTAFFRPERHSSAQRQSDHREGADLPRQGQFRHLA